MINIETYEDSREEYSESHNEEYTEENIDEAPEAEDEALEGEVVDEVEEAEAEDEAEEADAEAEENTEANAEESPEAEGEKKERKMGWAKKASASRKAKDEEAEKIAAQIAEANDKYARLFAEFDNFRKRTEKEKSTMYDMGARSVIEKMLDVVDNFERALSTISDEEKESPLAQGVDLIYKQLTTTLENLGVKPIEAVGKEFDPNFHNAVMHVDDDSVGDNIVVEEFQKGYTYKDSVVRFSMVKVAN